LRLLGYSSLDDVVGKHPAELSAPIQPGGKRVEVLARMHIANTWANGSERFDWIAVRYSDAGRPVQFEIGHVGAEIVCAICDQGIGIPEADREWLFNAFHRGHNVDDRPGTGLGLVIVKRCVDLHGCKINVESKLGEETVVTVRLPI
jgi:light-regulated signal transduction histidine kinase (bacteriophytochrome)